MSFRSSTASVQQAPISSVILTIRVMLAALLLLLLLLSNFKRGFGSDFETCMEIRVNWYPTHTKLVRGS